MPNAGEYDSRLAWLRKSPGEIDAFGQRFPGNPFLGHLWGVVEDVAASRETVNGSSRMVTSAMIRVRNYPALVAGDQLRDEGLGDVWTVSVVWRGDDEVLCEVSR